MSRIAQKNLTIADFFRMNGDDIKDYRSEKARTEYVVEGLYPRADFDIQTGYDSGACVDVAGAWRTVGASEYIESVTFESTEVQFGEEVIRMDADQIEAIFGEEVVDALEARCEYFWENAL